MRQRGHRGPEWREAPRAALAGRGPRVQVCGWCGGAGTHYLTCKTLRLPAGYRLSAGSGPRVPVRPGRRDVRGVRAMTWLIAVLAYACFAAFGLLVSVWLSWRIEQRAERRRDYRAVPRGTLISGGGPVRRRAPDDSYWPRGGDF